MSERARTVYIPPEARGLTEEELNEKEMAGKALKEGKETWEHVTPEYVRTKSSILDLREVERQIYLAQQNYERAKITQQTAQICFQTDLPVSIFFVGDVHYGALDTDYVAFKKVIKGIEDTPNAYIAFMSNLIENQIPAKFPDGMLNCAIHPEQQTIAMSKIAQQLSEKGKVIGAVVSPCHEGWTDKVCGQDVNKLIFDFAERHFPVMENGGTITLTFPGAEYSLVLFHQVGPFESTLNETHGVRQQNRVNLGMRGDIVVGGHKHNAAALMAYEDNGEFRRPVAYIRSGTFKGSGESRDQFSVGRYGTTGEPTGQSVILWPNKKKMNVFLDFEEGILAHESIYLHEMYKRDQAQK